MHQSDYPLGVSPGNMIAPVEHKLVHNYDVMMQWCERSNGSVFVCRVQGELWSVYVPWAVQNGLQSRLLMSVFLERYFEKSLEDLRSSLQLMPPPQGSLSN